jgi:hypothetical protein
MNMRYSIVAVTAKDNLFFYSLKLDVGIFMWPVAYEGNGWKVVDFGYHYVNIWLYY